MGMKQILLSIIDYLRTQIENDECSQSEIESICNMVSNNVSVSATSDDLARHFNTSHSNIRNVLVRYRDKPTPRRHYNLIKFMKIMPKRWIKQRDMD